jgi:hypothetical protein
MNSTGSDSKRERPERLCPTERKAVSKTEGPRFEPRRPCPADQAGKPIDRRVLGRCNRIDRR